MMPEEAQPAATAKIASAGTVPISALNNAPKGTTPRNQTARQPAVKLKVVIRRLPPGLSEAEFEKALGDEWKAGAGRVAWAVYKPGKISKDVAKVSRPSRAYLQLTQQAHLETLAGHVQTTNFIDARNTGSDPALVGPPTLEFAIHQRIPASKKRNDARQGLIDQDPEFIEFLESLTNPTVKPLNIDAMIKEAKEETVQSTPLIQHLREKKAAKEKAKNDKATKAARAAKAEPAETKADAKAKDSDKTDSKSSRRRKADVSKKETSTQAASKPQTTTTQAKADGTKVATESKKKERPAGGAGAVAASLIQRDLGIKGGSGGSGRGGSRRQGNKGASNENASPSAITIDGTSNPKSNASKTNSTSTAAPSASPTVLKRQPQETTAQPVKATIPAKNTTATSQTKSTATASVPATATKAFLKHANPSQGVTETNLQEALCVFGTVSKVEIDKRKGFAYAEFAEAKSLQAAIAAGLIKVAEANVQVMERKERSKPNSGTNATSTSTSTAANKSSSTPTASTGTTGGGKNHPGTRGGRSGRGRGPNTRNAAQQSTAAVKTSTEPKDTAISASPASAPAKPGDAT